MHILAYIDPGLGALIWQSIIGFFVGLFFYLRRTRKWIGGLMAKVFGSGQKGNDRRVNLPVAESKMEADHF